MASDRNEASVTLVSRDPYLTIRPQLYEASLHELRVPLASVLNPINARFYEANVVALDTSDRRIILEENDASGRVEIIYNRLILATGSELRSVPMPGLVEYSFNIDTFAAAAILDAHLANLARAASLWSGRDTIVMVGAGFTGIELATGIRDHLRVHWGQARAAAARLILVQRSGVVGHDLGENSRPFIETALHEQQIELHLNTQLARVESGAV